MRNPLWENFRMERPANIEEGEQILVSGEYCKVKRVFRYDTDNETADVGIIVERDGELIPEVFAWNEYQQVYGE